MSTARMTVAQALVKFLDNQYVEFDGEETKFVEGIFTIFGTRHCRWIGRSPGHQPGKFKSSPGAK